MLPRSSSPTNTDPVLRIRTLPFILVSLRTLSTAVKKPQTHPVNSTPTYAIATTAPSKLHAKLNRPTELLQTPSIPSHRIILIVKPYIPRPLRVPPHKVLVTRRPLVLTVPRQHALDAHAHALDVLHGAPAGAAEQVEADDAVGVDVRVHGDFAVGERDEGYFGGFCF